jgi:hypothetical protein
VVDWAVEEEVAPGDAVGFGRRDVGLQELTEFGLEFGGELFVGVDGEDPGAGTFVDGGVFLCGEALPGFGEDLGVEGLSDLCGMVSRAGVDDDDLVGELDAGKGAGEVGFFVERDDGNGEGGWHEMVLRADGLV